MQLAPLYAPEAKDAFDKLSDANRALRDPIRRVRALPHTPSTVSAPSHFFGFFVQTSSPPPHTQTHTNTDTDTEHTGVHDFTSPTRRYPRGTPSSPCPR
jgi:hypothetical protein